MAASLLALSAAGPMIVAPSPAGAADAITVLVHRTHFEGPDPAAPSRIYAEPQQEIIFKLADPADRHHTVTVIPAHCERKPRSLCDKAFDDPFAKYPDRDNPTVTFRWSEEGEYRFYDRYAWEESRREMTGIFIITHSPPTVQPAPPSASTSTTVTTSPATPVTTAPTTTTSAPTAVRPQLVPDPPSTTTTTAASAPPASAKSGNPPPPPAADQKKESKGKPKDKAGKSSSASTETTGTTVPAPPDTAWIDSLLGPSSLTPSPALPADQPAGNGGGEVALDAARAASLLEKPASDGDGNGVLLLTLAAIAAVLLAGGCWAWCTRASRYDPA